MTASRATRHQGLRSRDDLSCERPIRPRKADQHILVLMGSLIVSRTVDQEAGSITEALKSLRTELQYLRDCEDIRQAMYAYARGVDRGDQQLLEPAFHDDAYDDHGNFKGDKSMALSALKRSAQVKETTASFHHIGNILIDLRGDEANVETYFMASQRREDGGKTYTRMRAGRYLDHFVKRDGEWRVLNRRVIDDWSRLDEVVATAREIGPDNNHGTRDRNDPSYAVAGFLEHRRR